MTLSALGDSMSLVALLWLVYQTTGSVQQLGWFVAAYTAPVALGGLVAGSVLDRFDRRAVLLADNLLRGAAFAIVPLLSHAHALALWHLYLVAALFALCKMLPLAGVPAMIPELVPPEELALRFVTGQPVILATTVMFMLFNVGLGIILVLLPVYARTVLTDGAGASGFGVLSSALAGGELAGSAAAGMVASRWPLGRAIAASQLAAGAFLLGLGALPQLPGAVAFLGLSAFCSGPLTVWAQTLRMQLIPADLRGRVLGLLRTSMQATPPLGGIAASVLLADPGLRQAVLATALLIGVPGAVGLRLRSLSTAGTDPATAGRD